MVLVCVFVFVVCVEWLCVRVFGFCSVVCVVCVWCVCGMCLCDLGCVCGACVCVCAVSL